MSMALKNLFVHVDQGERADVRLAVAAEMARTHGARLVGMFGQRAEPRHVGVVSKWPSEEYVEAALIAKAAFERATSELPDVKWLDINRGSDAALVARITEFARFSDLVILGQHDESASSLVPADLAEEVVLNSGRPVLMIPYVSEWSEVGRRPLIAWNSSRESAHAVNDALPLLSRCEEAIVLSVDMRHDLARTSCDALVEHLACHGIQAKAEILVSEDVGIMDLVLNRISDLDADLLVMGAHGSIGLPFVSRGAGTRYILQHMVVPVLMSN